MKILPMAVVAVVVLTFALVGCATTEVGSAPEHEGVESSLHEVIPVSPPEEPAAPQPEVQMEPEVQTEQEPDVPEAAVPESEPDVQLEPEPAEEQPFSVTQDVYDQTFAEVQQTINELKRIIAARDFEAWQNHLTPRYSSTYSDPEVLERSSQSAILVRNNIVLRSLRDYFTYVVAPSRANARLSDIVFVDENTVEAIMEVNTQRYLLYLLTRDESGWKIDTF